jgi:hypothetical protein
MSLAAGLRGLRRAARVAPLSVHAVLNAHLALALDQLVMATNWSNITPLVFFDALEYSKACFFVIARRALIDNV